MPWSSVLKFLRHSWPCFPVFCPCCPEKPPLKLPCYYTALTWHVLTSLTVNQSLSSACCPCLRCLSSACALSRGASVYPEAFASLFPKCQHDVLFRVESFAWLLLAFSAGSAMGSPLTTQPACFSASLSSILFPLMMISLTDMTYTYHLFMIVSRHQSSSSIGCWFCLSASLSWATRPDFVQLAVVVYIFSPSTRAAEAGRSRSAWSKIEFQASQDYKEKPCFEKPN